MQLKGKNVLVVGLGESGKAAVRFLISRGAHVAVTDQKGEENLADALSEFRGIPLECHLGDQSAKVFEGRDLVCVSPGVPGDLPGLLWARKRRIPVIGEMGLAVRYLQAPMLAVTGTNGKSTTATLIAHLLKEGGEKVALAGNIGKPLLDLVGQRYRFLVVEVSSFQLETVTVFHPRISVILNVTEDHLDRYRRFRDYLQAKMRILKDQTYRDFVVYNADDARILPFVRRSSPRKIPFSIDSTLKQGLFFASGRIVRRWKNEFEDYPLKKARLTGWHNIQNMMAAIGAVRAVGLDPDRVQQGLESFEGLPHRMELVAEKNGVRFYDDSKGTNVDAVVKSLRGFEDQKVLLIAGGRHKGGSYLPMREAVSQKVKRLFTIGEAAPRIARELKGATEIREALTLDAAVQGAAEAARPGDVVLLSPACSSFDQFRDYKERGERFQQLVGDLS